MSKIGLYTFFSVCFSLNGIEFDVNVRDLNAEEKEAFGALFSKESSKAGRYTEAKETLLALEEQMKINYELIGCVDLLQKAKLLWEQKSLLGELKTAKEALERLGSEPLELEAIYEKRFMQTVSGKDKDALVKAISNEGVLYSTVVELLLHGFEKARKEKLSNS